MAAINRNRYRLITLLYVIFVCLSVLNIPATYLDSNAYSIKTLEYQEDSTGRFCEPFDSGAEGKADQGYGEGIFEYTGTYS